MNSETRGSLGIGLGGIRANLGGRSQAGETEAFQVSRKAIIQSTFRDLYKIERSALTLDSNHTDLPSVPDSDLRLETLLDSSKGKGLLVDPSKLHRGDLLEVDVELEADPIYRMATIINTFFDLMKDNHEMLESAANAQLPEIHSVARLLDSLLAGLVPIHGRLVDYTWVTICGREVLIHQSLLDQLVEEARPATNPAYLVGVAQGDLFRKDIRRVLFSQARYTVFCRLAASGLRDKWNPIKMAEVFSGLSSDLEELIQGLGNELMIEFSKGMRAAEARTTTDQDSNGGGQQQQHDAQLLGTYARSVAAYHGQSIGSSAIESMVAEIPRSANWRESVDGYRPVFAKMTRRVDESLGVETAPEAFYKLRSQALNGFSPESVVETDGSQPTGDADEPRCERFLDSEIVAIYW